MKINDITSRLLKPADQEKPSAARTTPSDREKIAKEALDISPAVARVRELVTKVLDSPDDSGRVEALKEKIAKGEYVLDSRLLARRMLGKDD